MQRSDFLGRRSDDLARSAVGDGLTGLVVGVRYAPIAWWKWWRLQATIDWSRVAVWIDGVRCSPAIDQVNAASVLPFFVAMDPGMHVVEVRSLLGADDLDDSTVAPLVRHRVTLARGTVRSLGFLPDREPLSLPLHPLKAVLDREFR